MKQKELEMILQSLKSYESPEPSLEQYPTPPVMAADVLYSAFGMGDIGGKTVIDLGCGTGVFAIGANLLGASEVVGVDVDPSVLRIARENAEANKCSIDFLEMEVEKVAGRFDTCVQNPPFGAQKKHADLPFLNKALEIAGVTYTIHNTQTADFIEKTVADLDRVVTYKKQYSFDIKHTFEFHRKERKAFEVTLFRVE
jgi:putative methylase